MVSFLFWNVYRKQLQDRVAGIARANDVDVIILAECAIERENMLAALNQIDGPRYAQPNNTSTVISIFTKLDTSLFEDVGGSHRMPIWRLRFGPFPYLLLAAIHFQSKSNWDEKDQALEAAVLAKAIRDAEAKQSHQRTVIVGDFNMNPFDSGMSSSHGFHGVMTRELAKRTARIVAGNDYPFFYNPMWGHFGDRTDGSPGTYFFDSSKPGNHFWNMYDQVLLRPALMDHLADLQILDSDGELSLTTTRGVPDKGNYSDHLPIFFRLDI